MAADVEWRRTTTLVDELRSRARPKGKPSEEERAALAVLKAELQAAEAALAEVTARHRDVWARVPNPPEDSVPDGSSEEDSVELRRVGEPFVAGFPLRDHLELTGYDTERAGKVSGSRFVYRLGPAALVELALYRYALDTLVARGFTPVLPPVLVREEAMFGTGFLPTEASNLYTVEPDGLYLTGTSEVALAALHLRELFEPGTLPLRYAGYSTCFRREAGAAGRDTRGILRVHQFDKVEMFAFVEPEDSAAEHERLLALEEEIVRGLGLAYRVVNVAAGDLGAPAAKKYDIEAYIPSESRYREITSCSNTTDYQARRLEVRYRDGSGRPRYPHTLNGTAMTARFLIALVESNQQPDGSVVVPEVLHPYGAPKLLEVATGS
jgi:seryl-tRNA synthetase